MSGRDEISQIVNNLHVGGGDTIINKAHKFYQVKLFLFANHCSLGRGTLVQW
jgi:hypothetical protein